MPFPANDDHHHEAFKKPATLTKIVHDFRPNDWIHIEGVKHIEGVNDLNYRILAEESYEAPYGIPG